MHRLILASIAAIGLLGSAMVFPARAQLRGEVPGSYLIFPEFDITPGVTTQLRISDVQDPALGGVSHIHIQYICPGDAAGVCATVNSQEITTFHGTLILDVATELGAPPPCTNGYIVAFAVDINRVAISNNNLIGSYRITGAFGVDVATAANAIAVQSAKPQGTLLGSLDGSGEVVLTFGVGAGSDYVALPDTLYSDFRAVDLAAGRRTQLIVLTPTIKSGLPNPSANIGIQWWNQFEDEHSTTNRLTCWQEFELEALSALFQTTGLGTPFGSLKVRAITAGGYSPAILGVIRETGPDPGATLRRMYHTGAKSSTFSPDPGINPPPPPPPPPPDRCHRFFGRVVCF